MPTPKYKTEPKQYNDRTKRTRALCDDTMVRGRPFCHLNEFACVPVFEWKCRCMLRYCIGMYACRTTEPHNDTIPNFALNFMFQFLTGLLIVRLIDFVSNVYFFYCANHLSFKYCQCYLQLVKVYFHTVHQFANKSIN